MQFTRKLTESHTVESALKCGEVPQPHRRLEVSSGQERRSMSSNFFVMTAALRENSHTYVSTALSTQLGGFLAIHRGVHPSPPSNSRSFPQPRLEPTPPSGHSHSLPLAPSCVCGSPPWTCQRDGSYRPCPLCLAYFFIIKKNDWQRISQRNKKFHKLVWPFLFLSQHDFLHNGI